MHLSYTLKLDRSLSPLCILRKGRAEYMERLKSSFKSLHGAIASINPSPTCIQEPRTHSFTEIDLCSSLSHLCCDSATTSSTVEANRDEDAKTTMPFFSFDFSGEMDGSHSVALGPISSNRFFFSPRTSNSIMEEARVEKAGGATAAFRDDSTMVAMASRDPYLDFRASMEEMVAAHELREWHYLEELLLCYLSLNEKKHHRVIVLAFVDLLMQLVARDKEEHGRGEI